MSEKSTDKASRSGISMFDIDAIKIKMKKLDKDEELGRNIGIVIHWLIVKPVQVGVVLAKIIWLVAAFMFVNVHSLMSLAALVFIVSFIYIFSTLGH